MVAGAVEVSPDPFVPAIRFIPVRMPALSAVFARPCPCTLGAIAVWNITPLVTETSPEM